MRKNVYLLLLGCICAINALAQLPETSIVVKGHVEGLKDSIMMQVMEGNGEQFRVFYHKFLPDDNGMVRDGRFTVINSYQDTVPGLFYLFIPDSFSSISEMRIPFYANPGDTVYVEGKGMLLADWKITSKAKLQEELSDYYPVAYQEHVNYQKAVMDYLDYRKYRRNATMSDEEWDYSGKQLELKKAISDSLKIEYQLAQLEAMKKMPINTVWMQKIGVMCNFFTKDKVKWAIKDLYQTRMREINRYPEGKRILALLYPSPKAELGKKAVDGDLMDLQGRTYHLSDFKGKYVLLDFWSTSCGPCIAAIPSMKKFKERHPDMVIVSLCIDQFKYWKTNRHYQNLPWYNLNDGGGQLGLAKSYDANAVPTYILITPEGNYVNKWVGQEIFQENGILEQLLYPQP